MKRYARFSRIQREETVALYSEEDSVPDLARRVHASLELGSTQEVAIRRKRLSRWILAIVASFSFGATFGELAAKPIAFLATLIETYLR